MPARLGEGGERLRRQVRGERLASAGPVGRWKGLVKKIEKGKATLADLTAAGAVQLGCTYPIFSHTAYSA